MTSALTITSSTAANGSELQKNRATELARRLKSYSDLGISQEKIGMELTFFEQFHEKAKEFVALSLTTVRLGANVMSVNVQHGYKIQTVF